LEAAPKKDWVNIAFLSLTPVIGIAGTALWTWSHGFHLWMLVLGAGMYLAVGMSICAGYHRFFSHKTYECSRFMQAFYAFFGAMAAENSILWWSASHRVHHKYQDKDWDPYNIRRGFWWAHIVWIFFKWEEKPNSFENSPDLLANPIVMWQHRWKNAILIFAGFGIPTAIGAMFGDPIAGLLWGGFLRIVVVHHTTFFVNSLAHTFGKPTFNAEASARDNWMVALLTLGEGYHSFHHRFPSDFRNGIRWFDWDPAKWFIRGLRGVGLASDLRAATPPQIEQARLQAALRVAQPRIETAHPTIAQQVRERVQHAVEHLEIAVAQWRQDRRRQARASVRESRRQWKVAIKMLSQVPDIA